MFVKWLNLKDKLIVRIASAIALSLIGVVSLLRSCSFCLDTKRNQKNQDDFQLAAAQTQNRRVLH
jgi:hypothetical protein